MLGCPNPSGDLDLDALRPRLLGLGEVDDKDPSLKSALTFAASASSGSVKLRAKLP
jgi:hypothetical protein